MRKLLYIIQREYLTRVRTKSFLVTTFLVPLLFLGLPFLSIYIANSASNSIQTVAVSDPAQKLADIVLADKDDGSLYFNRNIIMTEDSFLQNKLFDAILIIPADFDIQNTGRSPIRFLSKKKAGLGVRSHVKSVLSKALMEKKVKTILGNNSESIDLEEKIVINFEKADGPKDKSDMINLASIIGYVLGLLIYFTITVYGTMIMKGVMEEKNNRIMEVLISSVKPWQLMFGKITGIGAVGLTQFFIWIVLMSLGSLLVMPLLGLSIASSPTVLPANTNEIDPSEMLSLITELKQFNFTTIAIGFAVYFIGGFFLYGSLFAAVGAAGADDTNAQTLSLPLISPIMIAFFMMMGALNDPEGGLAFWGSIIPFTSPVIMPALLGFHPPIWQIALSVFILFFSILVVAFISGKIYRTGVLMYGKKVTFAEMAKWIIR